MSKQVDGHRQLLFYIRDIALIWDLADRKYNLWSLGLDTVVVWGEGCPRADIDR